MIKNILTILFISLLIQFTKADCTITATSSGSTTGYTQVYVLVDNAGVIIDFNNTGSFTVTEDVTYSVHALNYDPADAPSPLAVIGQNITTIGSTTSGCMNTDFITDKVDRICSANACTIERTICETAPLVVSTTGENSSYTQLYVLVDASTGLIVATNTTGDFSTSISAPNVYEVYALNYDPSDTPSPLPTIGQPISNTGTTTSGCRNSDFETDYICYTVTTCTAGCANETIIEDASGLIANTSNYNTNYVQVYVLTDENGNFLASNSTGDFSSFSVNDEDNFRIYALNYDGSNPPSPLPSTMNTGDDVSTISGGCFDLDFSTDYVCFTVAVVLDADLITFEAVEKEEYNQIIWELNEATDFDFELQQSVFNQSFQTIETIFANNKKAFSFDDYNFQSKTSYRLKIIDSKGNYTYSNTIILERKNWISSVFNIYPNPVENELNIVFDDELNTSISIELYDVLGRNISKNNFNIQSKNQLSLSTNDLSSGVYFIQINGQNIAKSTHKFIKR